MARNLSNGNYLACTLPTAVPQSMVSIFCKLKPDWNSGESGTGALYFWLYQIPGSPGYFLMLLNELSTVQVGLYDAAEHRLIVSNAGLFVQGNWANHLFTVSAEAGGVRTQRYYVNNVEIGNNVIPAISHLNFTLLSLYSQIPAVSTAFAEFAAWDHEFDSTERTIVNDAAQGPGCLETGRLFWNRITGTASPEPSEEGPDLTLVGSPTLATHPPVGNCDAPTVNTNRRGDSNILLAA